MSNPARAALADCIPSYSTQHLYKPQESPSSNSLPLRLRFPSTSRSSDVCECSQQGNPKPEFLTFEYVTDTHATPY